MEPGQVYYRLGAERGPLAKLQKEEKMASFSIYSPLLLLLHPMTSRSHADKSVTSTPQISCGFGEPPRAFDPSDPLHGRNT